MDKTVGASGNTVDTDTSGGNMQNEEVNNNNAEDCGNKENISGKDTNASDGKSGASTHTGAHLKGAECGKKATLIEEAKQNVRSVLISCQGGMSVSRLVSDYSTLCFSELPWRQLGHVSPHALLLSMPDVCTCRCSGGQLWVTAVADSSTQHIKKMVDRQKSQSGSARGGGSTRPRSAAGGGAGIYPRPPIGNPWRPTVPFHLYPFGSMRPARHPQMMISPSSRPSFPPRARPLMPEPTFSSHSFAMRRAAPFNHVFRMPLRPGQVSTVPRKQLPASAVKTKSVVECRGARQTADVKSSSDTGAAAGVTSPVKVIRTKLTVLLEQHSTGISCQRLSSLYTAIFGQQLNLATHGYESLQQILLAPPAVARVVASSSSGDELIMPLETPPASTDEETCDESAPRARSHDENTQQTGARGSGVVAANKLNNRAHLAQQQVQKKNDQCAAKQGTSDAARDICVVTNGSAAGNKACDADNDDASRPRANTADAAELSSGDGDKQSDTRPIKTYAQMAQRTLQKVNITSSEDDTGRVQLHKQIITNIRELLLPFTSGLPLADLHSHYQICFEQSIEVQQVGCDSLEALVACFSHNQLYTSRSADTGVLRVYAHGPQPPVLSSEVFPRDVATSDFQFSTLLLPDMPFNEFNLEIQIAEVFTPFKFFYHLTGPSYAPALDKLSAKLDLAFAHGLNAKYRMLPAAIQVGQVCACPYLDQGYHRVVILHVQPPRVKLYFVDFGTIDWTKLEDLRYLPTEFCSLPAQALMARLHGIEPVNGAGWSTAASKQFLQLLQSSPSYLAVIRDRPLEGVASFTLWDTSTDEDININERLIQLGHAVATITDTQQPADEDVASSGSVNFSESSTSSCELTAQVQETAASASEQRGESEDETRLSPTPYSVSSVASNIDDLLAEAGKSAELAPTESQLSRVAPPPGFSTHNCSQQLDDGSQAVLLAATAGHVSAASNLTGMQCDSSLISRVTVPLVMKSPTTASSLGRLVSVPPPLVVAAVNLPSVCSAGVSAPLAPMTPTQLFFAGSSTRAVQQPPHPPIHTAAPLNQTLATCLLRQPVFQSSFAQYPTPFSRTLTPLSVGASLPLAPAATPLPPAAVALGSPVLPLVNCVPTQPLSSFQTVAPPSLSPLQYPLMQPVQSTAPMTTLLQQAVPPVISSQSDSNCIKLAHSTMSGADIVASSPGSTAGLSSAVCGQLAQTVNTTLHSTTAPTSSNSERPTNQLSRVPPTSSNNVVGDTRGDILTSSPSGRVRAILRHVKPIAGPHNRTVHLINVRGEGYMVSADISSFLWAKDILEVMLKVKRLNVKRISLNVQDNQLLFAGLIDCDVVGVVHGDSLTDPLTVYHVTSCLHLLFAKFTSRQHRALAMAVCESFSASDPFWYSVSASDADNVDDCVNVTVGKQDEEQGEPARSPCLHDSTANGQVQRGEKTEPSQLSNNESNTHDQALTDEKTSANISPQSVLETDVGPVISALSESVAHSQHLLHESAEQRVMSPKQTTHSQQQLHDEQFQKAHDKSAERHNQATKQCHLSERHQISPQHDVTLRRVEQETSQQANLSDKQDNTMQPHNYPVVSPNQPQLPQNDRPEQQLDQQFSDTGQTDRKHFELQNTSQKQEYSPQVQENPPQKQDYPPQKQQQYPSQKQDHPPQKQECSPQKQDYPSQKQDYPPQQHRENPSQHSRQSSSYQCDSAPAHTRVSSGTVSDSCSHVQSPLSDTVQDAGAGGAARDSEQWRTGDAAVTAVFCAPLQPTTSPVSNSPVSNSPVRTSPVSNSPVSTSPVSTGITHAESPRSQNANDQMTPELTAEMKNILTLLKKKRERMSRAAALLAEECGCEPEEMVGDELRAFDRKISTIEQRIARG